MLTKFDKFDQFISTHIHSHGTFSFFSLQSCTLMTDISAPITPTIKLYNLDRYTFNTKEAKLEKDTAVGARLKREHHNEKQFFLNSPRYF
jgi:hypothetical protein